MANVKTAQQFLDILQMYGMISLVHTSYIPWLMEHADGYVDVELRKTWFATENKRPTRNANVAHMPDIPLQGN